MFKKSLLLTLILACLLPLGMKAQTTVTIGNGTTGSYWMPFVMFPRYFFGETIYTADRMNQSENKTITSIAFDYLGNSNFNGDSFGIDIYMKNTDQSSFSSGSNWVLMSEDDRVFSGTVTLPSSSGWFTIELDDEFEYDYTKNLVIAINKTTNNGDGSYSAGYAFNTTSGLSTYQTVYISQSTDTSPYNPTSPGSGTRYQTLSNIKITFKDESSFPVPANLTASSVKTHEATLAWDETENAISYNVKYHETSASEWTTETGLTTNSLLLSNLDAETEYEAQVQAVYSEGSSDWSSVYSFSTLPLLRYNISVTTSHWNDKYSWTPYVIPTANHDVIIEQTTKISAADAVANNVTIYSGKTLTIQSGYSLTCNTITNNGTLIIADGGQLICNNEVQATVQKSITGYGDNEYGWYFIASPVTEDLAPSAVANMTDNEYRLYYYNEPDHYWKYTNGLDNFKLTNGKGYLYARQADETLSFSGTVNASNDPITVENLSYTTDAGDLAGFNLVGNPFPCNATIDCDAFYKMDENGEFLEAATSGEAIAPCTGVMVQLESSENSVTFSKSTEPASISRGIVNLKVNRTSGLFVDNAIVRFDGGSLLNKLVIKEDATRIYLPKGNQEYAIVNAEGEGELPVNFKASENGVYIIAADVDTEVVSYLHLIDNITGANVDLLASPVYTFTAKTTDYAYRFRLVFNASDVAENSAMAETFAYFNGNEWQVVSEGNATLSLIDMTGRVVSTKQIEGNATVSTDDLTAGVYVMRLESEMTVRTQKIVVK